MAASQLDREQTPPPERRRSSIEDEEEFSYATLVNRWRRERSTTTLTKMDGDFYERFDRYLKQLHEDYQREQSVNPATPKVLILLDELTNLQRVRDDLYNLREKKIVTSALIAAREARPDKANLTREEEALFEQVLSSLKAARAALLRHEQAAPQPAPEPKPAGGPPAPPEPLAPAATPLHAAQPAAALPERVAEAAPEATLPGAPLPAPTHAAPQPAAEEVTAADAHAESRRAVASTRMLVRVKAPIEPFVAPDLRHYRLQAEDVAALPREVAHVLIARGLAAPVGA